MNILDSVVLPVFVAEGVPGLRTPAAPNQVIVPCELDPYSGTRTLVHVIADDEDANLKLWAGICAVAQPRRAAMLELTNRLNMQLRWLKFSVANELVVMEFDLALGDMAHPGEHFKAAFAGYMQVLHQHWADVIRLATRRGRRSRLEREVEGLLAGQAAAGGD